MDQPGDGLSSGASVERSEIVSHFMEVEQELQETIETASQDNKVQN
jgi:hypothetical protein